MDTTPGVAPGTAVNLMLGYKVSWDPGDPGSSPFYAVPNPAIVPSAPAFDTASGGTWGMPLISLHGTAESVLSAVFDVRVPPDSAMLSPPIWPSGALIARNADRTDVMHALQAQLGIDFSVEGRGYALLEIRRETGTSVHCALRRGVFQVAGPEDAPGRAFRQAVLALPPALATGNAPRALRCADAANQYLALFADSGTHFVSAIAQGDRIYQVLAYAAEQWQQVQNDFARFPELLEGPDAYRNFFYYTRPLNADGYGLVVERGIITSTSRDSQVAASVAGGNWNEATWARGDSLLAPWAGATIDFDRFNQVVPIAITLAPLSLFMDDARKVAAWQALRAGMTAIYGNHVAPAFPGAPDPDFGGVYPPPAIGLLSTIATPTINAYVQRCNLGAVALTFPEVVTSLSLVANLVEIRQVASTTLPGASVAILANIVNVVAPADGAVPKLVLADDAYESFELVCDGFYGAMLVASTSTGKTCLIADGLLYGVQIGSAGRFVAASTGHAHGAPSSGWLPRVAAQLSCALTGADGLLAAWQAAPPKQGIVLITRLAQWIAAMIPAGCDDTDLALVRLDALYLARAARQLAGGVRQVPYLTYQAYQSAVAAIRDVSAQIAQTIASYQDQILQRKIAEQLVTDLQAINQNVIDTGQLLTGYIQACQQHQQDLARQYQDIVDADQAALAQTSLSINTLQAAVDAQRSAVQTAVDLYMNAIEQQQLDEIVALSFSIVQSIFTLGFSAEVPGSAADDAKVLAAIVNDIQNIMAVLAAVEKLEQAIQGGQQDIAAADAALAKLGTAPAQSAATLDWSEFRIRMKNAVEKGPACPERNDVTAAIDILVLRGEALVRAQSAAATIAAQTYKDQRAQTIEANQAARLAQLVTLLDPASVGALDLGHIDLIGLTGELAQTQSRMMAQLARAITLQDLALQYEYLQLPSAPPATFDLISLGVYIVAQMGALLAAKGALNPAPGPVSEPVNYVLANIPASVLAAGAAFSFQIPLAAKQFMAFTMVRIAAIDVQVDSLAHTDSGQFEVQLLYRGEPFYDVNAQHVPISFSTEARITNYLGDVAADGPSIAHAAGPGDDYSMVTPFSDWEISFPANEVNRAMRFDDAAVAVTLSFHLVAQINPAPGTARSRELAATASPGGDVPTMLAAMNGNSCLTGWDVVFNYTEDKINAFLQSQYEALKKADAGHLVVPKHTDQSPADPTTGVATYCTWSMTLGSPSVAFSSGNNQYATVFLDILDATYEYGIIEKDGTRIVVSSFPPPALPDGAHIKGQVALGSVKGSVSSQHSVVLDLPAGTWNVANLDILTGNPQFNQYLSTQLASVATSYVLGTLDLVANPTIAALTPTAFELNVILTNSGRNLLQLFIVTDGKAPNQLSLNNVPEPVPAGMDCSLLISSRVLFESILPISFAQASSMLAVTGAPTAPGKSWNATATGSLGIPVSLGDASDSEGNMRISGASIALDLGGMTITPVSSALALAYSRTTNQPFQSYYCSEGHYQGMCLGGQWGDQSVDVTTSLSAGLPIVVTGQGAQQSIQFATAGLAVNIDGAIASGPCSGGSLQRDLTDAYRTAAQPAITTAVTVTFPALSIFAINNLLFPNQNIINMAPSVYAPGDLVIFGTFASTPPAVVAR